MKAETAWTRSEALALGQQSCTFCFGLGMRPAGRGRESVPCNCVYRAIFRACYDRFREAVSKDKYHATDLNAPPPIPFLEEEFCADFCLLARRALTQEQQHRIFRFHYLLGANWSACCRKLGMERGEFFHEVYRIQQTLGAAFRQAGLFPVYGYFAQTPPPAEKMRAKVA